MPVPQAKRVESFEELLKCFEDAIPCIPSYEEIFDFQKLRDDDWLVENVGQCPIRFSRPTNNKVVDPSD